MQKRQLLRSLGVYSVAGVLVCSPILADTKKDKQNELKENQAAVAQYQKELKSTTEQKKTTEQEISSLDQTLIGIEQELNETSATLEQKRALVANKTIELQSLEEELSLIEEEKNTRYEQSKERMVQMYKNKKKGFFQLIFSAENLGQALHRAEYINRISQCDDSVLSELKNVMDNISEKRDAVSNTKKDLEKEEEAVERTLAEQEDLQLEVESKKDEKARLVRELEEKQEGLEEHIDLLEKESEKLEDEIRKLTATSSQSKYSGGELGWPVPGHYRLSSEYNPRNSPISGIYEFHTGIDIPAPYGIPVVASGDGTVIYSGVRNGYGNTIMIDHGGGIVTLYGHNSSLVARVGQVVKKGETVAKIGSTGYSTGNHCHFEVRKNGTHTNPWNYLKK